MLRALYLLFSLFMVLNTSQVFASPKEELAKTRKEINNTRAYSRKLENEAKVLAEKYSALTLEMVKTATALQASEAKLSIIEEKLRILTEQITEKTALLTSRKKDLAVMVQSAVKLSQTPPEAIILMPGDMMDNMKASRALKMTADSIKYHAQSIREQMAELELLKEKVAKNQEEAVKERGQLEEQRILLQTQIAEHKILQQKLNVERQKTETRAQFLARKAEDLQGLIAALEKEKEQQDEVKSDTGEPEGEKGELRSFRAARGQVRVPVAGKLLQRYGVEGRNETSKGITITTRSGAFVTAPYDAEVLFTGVFMEYGKVIILRHSDGFHTLLAGMTKIDTAKGEFLLEGEPIGAMGDKESNNRLYMELRLNNQPIDPTPWVRGLSRQ